MDKRELIPDLKVMSNKLKDMQLETDNEFLMGVLFGASLLVEEALDIVNEIE